MVGDLLVGSRGSVLRGFAFERSQMSRSIFRLRAFAQVLSVPDDDVSFALFEDLGDFSVEVGEAVAFTNAAEVADGRGRPFLARVDDCSEVVANLDELAPPTTGRVRLRELRAHCLVRLGDDEGARRELDLVAGELSSSEYDSDRALLPQANELRTALDRSHEEAVALLDRWAAATAEAIGLPNPYARP